MPVYKYKKSSCNRLLRELLSWSQLIEFSAIYGRVTVLHARHKLQRHNRALAQQRFDAGKVRTSTNIPTPQNIDGAVRQKRKSIFTMLLIVPLMLVSKFNTNDKSKSLFPNGTDGKMVEKDIFFVANNIICWVFPVSQC